MSVRHFLNCRWRTDYRFVSEVWGSAVGPLEQIGVHLQRTGGESWVLNTQSVPEIGEVITLFGKVYLKLDQRPAVWQHSLSFSGGRVDHACARHLFNAVYGADPARLMPSLYNLLSTLEHWEGEAFVRRLFVRPGDVENAPVAIQPVAARLILEIIQARPEACDVVPSMNRAALESLCWQPDLGPSALFSDDATETADLEPTDALGTAQAPEEEQAKPQEPKVSLDAGTEAPERVGAQGSGEVEVPAPSRAPEPPETTSAPETTVTPVTAGTSQREGEDTLQPGDDETEPEGAPVDSVLEVRPSGQESQTESSTYLRSGGLVVIAVMVALVLWHSVRPPAVEPPAPVVTVDCFLDADADGWGDSTSIASPGTACPQGLAARTGDCSPADARVWPGAKEECDGVDNDCDANTPQDPGCEKVREPVDKPARVEQAPSTTDNGPVETVATPGEPAEVANEPDPPAGETAAKPCTEPDHSTITLKDASSWTSYLYVRLSLTLTGGNCPVEFRYRGDRDGTWSKPIRKHSKNGKVTCALPVVGTDGQKPDRGELGGLNPCDDSFIDHSNVGVTIQWSCVPTCRSSDAEGAPTGPGTFPHIEAEITR